MKPTKLPYNKFLESFKYAPRPAVNLLLERTREGSDPSAAKGSDPVQEVLLTKRKKPPFAGSWHLPGSFLLKGETLMDCVKRVAKEELGIRVGNVKFAGVFDDIDGDPRGHVVDVVYRCHIKLNQKRPGLFQKGRALTSHLQAVGDTAEMRFFKKLPKNIGFNHKDTLYELGYR